MVIKNPTSAPEECPRFDFCDINNCPLHEDYNKLQNEPSDPSQIHKQKCVAKTIRKKIGLKWKLKNKGMTPREIEGQERWDNLPEEVKQQRIARLKGLFPVSRCISAGLVVHRKKASQSLNTHTKDKTFTTEACIGGIRE